MGEWGVGQIGHRVLLRSRGNLDVRMTEARSVPLLMMPIEQLTD